MRLSKKKRRAPAAGTDLKGKPDGERKHSIGRVPSAMAVARNHVIIFDGSQHPMFVFERRTGQILDVNDTAESHYGWSRQEMLAMSLDGLRYRDDGAERVYVGEDDPRASGPGRSTTGGPSSRGWSTGRTRMHYRADGSNIEVEETIYDVSFEGNAAGLMLAEDVTERTRLEALTLQSQRLESLGQMAGGVAHDFNNILGAILNYASFVAEEVGCAAEASSGTTREHWKSVHNDVEKIREAAESATGLTRRLLAFARQEVVQPRVINVNDVVDRVAELLRRALGEHVVLEFSTSQHLWNVVADPTQLEQVLVNLSFNARDAMPMGGKLVIETDNFVVDEGYEPAGTALSSGGYVRIRVSDTGTGMESKVVEHAFEPFFTTRAASGGTGLGLASVYGAIMQAGGDIRLYSEVGLGTTVSILLPAVGEELDVVLDWQPGQFGEKGRTVLVVEDDDAIRDITERILVRNGYGVLLAAGGQEAVDILAASSRHIDLLLTDVVMPHTMGTEVADHFTQVHPGVPVVYMSGYARPTLGVAIGYGVALLEKPFTERTLLDKVEEALRNANKAPENPPVPPPNREGGRTSRATSAPVALGTPGNRSPRDRASWPQVSGLSPGEITR